MITQSQINFVIQKIIKVANPNKIIVFGSYANGSPTPDSDLDILVIKPSNEPRLKRASAIRKSLRGSKIPLDILVYTPEEIAAWQNVQTAFITRVLNEGKVVYAQ